MSLINRLGNPVVKVVLRSPLHRVMSRSVMLVTVTGRKSGRRYTTPVNYVRDGVVVTAISRTDRTWWKNLHGGAPVTVRIRGREVPGTGSLVAVDAEAKAAALRDFYGRVSPVRLFRSRAADPARGSVSVRIGLRPAPACLAGCHNPLSTAFRLWEPAQTPWRAPARQTTAFVSSERR